MKRRNNIIEYIKKSSEAINKKKRYFYIFGKIPVYLKEPLPKNIDLPLVLKKIEKVIPKKLTYNLEMIVITHLEEFDRKNTNAVYRDEAIYVTNRQGNDRDLLDDIVHEIAHSVEGLAGNKIYGDGLIEREFIGKRKKLFDISNKEGYDVHGRYFLELEYDEDFDKFLYKTIGYPLLTHLTMGLFSSPYAVTSIKEYFAQGFEEYFIGDRNYLKKISPSLYNKIEKYLDF